MVIIKQLRKAIKHIRLYIKTEAYTFKIKRKQSHIVVVIVVAAAVVVVVVVVNKQYGSNLLYNKAVSDTRCISLVINTGQCGVQLSETITLRLCTIASGSLAH